MENEALSGMVMDTPGKCIQGDSLHIFIGGTYWIEEKAEHRHVATNARFKRKEKPIVYL